MSRHYYSSQWHAWDCDVSRWCWVFTANYFILLCGDGVTNRVTDWWIFDESHPLSSARRSELKIIKVPRSQCGAGVRAARCGMMDPEGSHRTQNSIKIGFWDKMFGIKLWKQFVVITTLFFSTAAAKFWRFIWLKFSLFHRFICDWNKIVKLFPRSSLTLIKFL